MSDFDALRARVEEAAETLASAEAERHRQDESLAGLLGQLESRFDAQRRELEFYKARVEPLEAINDQLAGLMDRLLVMIDSGFGEASVVPLREAAAHAARILERDMDAACFENVGMAELAAERDIEAEQGVVLPEIVSEAHRSATGEEAADTDLIAEMMDALAAAGEAGEGGAVGLESVEALAERLAAGAAALEGVKDGAPNVRALLARVEAAVEEARARVAPCAAGETADSAETRSAVG